MYVTLYKDGKERKVMPIDAEGLLRNGYTEDPNSSAKKKAVKKAAKKDED